MYAPVMAEGAGSERVIAYLRGENVMTVAARWTQGAKEWGETSVRVPVGMWRNRLTGEIAGGGAVKVGELLSGFPVALLTRES
jgi:(1->4)-alpha-D-glucan 1-alpha-D-glucosylmutase